MSKVPAELCGIKPKIINGHCNILRSLYNREINGKRQGIMKAAYQTVNPNCSILDVCAPTPFLRKFTPDGRHFIAFCSDLASVIVYEYQGCSMAFDLMKGFNKNILGLNAEEDVVRHHVFERLLKWQHSINITPSNETFCRNFSLFTKDGNHVLVCSYDIERSRQNPFDNLPSNDEARSSTRTTTVSDYTIHLININHGYVSDTIEFQEDTIFFKDYNKGIYLFNYTLAVLSIKSQKIYIYEIQNEKFHLLKEIGQYCYKDDHNLITSLYSSMDYAPYQTLNDRCIDGLKHKLLVFLYKKAVQEGERTESCQPIAKFHQHFKELLSFCMCKIQLLDENHLFIKYTSNEEAKMSAFPSNDVSYFMVYNLVKCEILDVFENSSDELFKVYENFCDDFRLSFSNRDGSIPCSLSNNIFAWGSHKNAKETMIDEYNGTTELKKLVLGQLPLAAQSYSSSPYLNASIYNYNERWISPFEIPRPNAQHAIGFYSRESGLPKFYLHTSETYNNQPDSPISLVEFIFHPTEPFAISCVSESEGYVINFHIYKPHM